MNLNALSRNPARVAALFSIVIMGPALGAAAQEHKPKVPVLEKSGPSHQAFIGNVQSLDVEHYILNVNTVSGGNIEIFPVNKKVKVATADGKKLQLDSLTPGTNVMIYYEQKGDRRTVKDIVVMEQAPRQDKQKPNSRS